MHRAPLHTAVELRAILEAADAPELGARFGLSESVLSDPDAMVPIATLHDFTEAAADASGDAYFGLHFGQRIDRGTFSDRLGALALLMLSSPSIGAGLGHLIRYHSRFNEYDRYEVVEVDDLTAFCLHAGGPPRLAQVHIAEKTVAQILSLFSLVEPVLEPAAIHLAHSERPGGDELVRVFGIAPRYDQEFTAIFVATADLDRPIRGADPDVFRFLDRGFPKMAGEVREVDAGESFLARVATEVVGGLQTGEYTPDWVAARMGTSKRTLQRRVGEHGSSLSAVVQKIRQERSQGLLETDMSIGDIAFLLGYSNGGAFRRAYKAWFGVTPSEWRRRAERSHTRLATDEPNTIGS